MADRGSYGLGPRLDIEQLFLEAQNRWLRPAEICEILRNYPNFHISTEPPNRPPSGSLFLFDRKVLRYFRKDGHNWRKKKDGKTVKEAHEKLKVGSVDVLHCYYAHGEDNENFQRRSYWMLEQELMHIVFVHYLEVKGSRTSNSPSSSFTANHNKEPSRNTDSTSPTSTLTSLCEDADSADSHHTNSRYHSFLESSQLQSDPLSDKVNAGLLNSHFLQAGSNKHVQTAVPGGPVSYDHRDVPGSSSKSNHIMESQSLPSWEEVFEQCTTGYNGVPPHESTRATTQSVAIANEGNVNLGEGLGDGSLPVQSNWQIQFGNSSLNPQAGDIDSTTANLEWAHELDGRFYEQETYGMKQKSPIEPYVPVLQNEPLQDNHPVQLTSMDPPHFLHSNPENEIHAEGNSKYPFFVKQPLLDGEEGLKKVDSFSRWITRELGEVDDLNMRSSSGLSWTTVECGNVVDDPSLSPSLSQDQLFSIIDFSPKWAFADSETEVHIIGKFLKSGLEVAKYNWSCMFGELEVPADILTDGVLCCKSPPHNVARVPFYVTCSNRLACSEVREFDYRVGSTEDIDVKKAFDGNADEVHLFMRLDSLLSIRSSSLPDHLFEDSQEKQKLIRKLILLKEEAESHRTGETTVDGDLSPKEAKAQLLERAMKEKLFSWLLHRISVGGKGPCILDDSGQGVLHLTAALSCDWAIEPIVTAGTSINFRDVNGWTALHWAAFYGREEMVAILVSLGAATGLHTDPSPEFPLGRTPADLASGNGHKGISGFLAESSLTSYLSSLTVKDSAEASRNQAVQTISERTATPVGDGDVPDLSLKDSLNAISNATQAANRIYQVFRMQSFHRKKFAEGDDGILDEHALSVAVGKARNSAQPDGVAHAAAIQIQKKFRGWKKRKEFLIIRQRIVKIQAHVRGHQFRKKYKSIIWSVGILEKVILRWRRKGSGLRGFRQDALAQGSNVEGMPSKEDDYDFLKEGRKQNEERQQKALSRVKSMFYDAEGRAQYRRLLTVAEKFRDTKACNMDLSNPEEATDVDDDLIDIDSLLDDDTFMSMALEGNR